MSTLNILRGCGLGLVFLIWLWYVFVQVREWRDYKKGKK